MKEQNGKVEVKLEDYLQLYNFKKNLEEGKEYYVIHNYTDYGTRENNYIDITRTKLIFYTKDEVVENLGKSVDSYQNTIRHLEERNNKLHRELDMKSRLLLDTTTNGSNKLTTMSIWKFLKLRKQARKDEK